LAYKDLRDWIAALDRAGELKRIQHEVDPILEITEITDRVSKLKTSGGRPAGGQALLFEKVKGYSTPVLINQFGSERRMKMALGVESLDEISGRIRQFMDVKSPEGLLDKIRMLPMLADMGKFFPKVIGSGPCKEVIKKKDFSLLDVPVLQCWTPAASSPCRWSSPKIPGQASATSARIACRCTTPPPRACTGSGRRWGQSTTVRCCAARRLREIPPVPRQRWT
jgi:3-polyprenyl-4-hydroxybenzoate decarboxylase